MDSIKFSGGFISGLSLRSTRVMELTYSTEDGCDMHSSSNGMTGSASPQMKPQADKFAPVVGSYGQLQSYTVSADGLRYTYNVERCTETPSTTPTIIPAHLLGENASLALPQRLELVLPPRSLYILQGPWRYKYNHAIYGAEQTPSLLSPLGTPIAQRSSIIFRDKKKFT